MFDKKIITYSQSVAVLLLWLINPLALLAQEKGKILIKSYLPRDYKGASQNWAITEDQRGVLYFGSNNIMEYDGTTWRTIEVPRSTTVRSLVTDTSGLIYVGTVGNFGYLEPDLKGEMKYVSLSDNMDSTERNFQDVWNIYITPDGIYFHTFEKIIRYTPSSNKFKSWLSSENPFHMSFVVRNRFYAREFGRGVYELVNDTLRMMPNGDMFADERVYGMLPWENNQILMGTRNKGLFMYNPNIDDEEKITQWDAPVNDFLIENGLFHMRMLPDNLLLMASYRKGIVITDKKGNITTNITKQSGLPSESVLNTYLHSQDVLWAALDNGLAKIEINSPFTYWDNTSGIEGNVYNFKRFNDTLFVSTSLGLFYLNPDKNRDPANFVRVPGTSLQSWELTNVEAEGKKMLLMATNEGVMQVSGKGMTTVGKIQNVFTVYASKRYKGRVYAGTRNGLWAMEYRNGRWNELGKIANFDTEIRSIAEDAMGNLWLRSRYEGLFKMSPYTAPEIGKPEIGIKANISHIETNSEIVDVFNYYGDSTVLFSMDSGLFYFDEQAAEFVRYNKLGEYFASNKDPISMFDEEPNGNLWINSNYVLKPQPNGTWEEDTMVFYRLPEYSIGDLYPEADGTVWFGGSEGVFKLNSNLKHNHSDKFNTLIRKIVSSKDSVIFGGAYYKLSNGKRVSTLKQPKEQIPVLDYDHNSLVIEYAAIHYIIEDRHRYSYKLEGFDEDWSDWSDESKKEYTNLPEGKYTFRVKSQNYYEVEGYEASYSFVIRPPWYRSWWAYILYVILLGLSAWVFARLYSRSLRRDKEKLERLVEERTAEIRRQAHALAEQAQELTLQAHELQEAHADITIKNRELEQQKEEVQAQAEQLQIINAELEKLSIVARQTDNAIVIFDKTGELEWLNEGFTRMYGYTIEQYRKEKHSNITDISNNPNIRELIRVCMEEKRTVIYEILTRTRDNEELWAQTTLTPIVDNLGRTQHLIAIDSNITAMKHAQEEIVKQKEQIEHQRDELQRAIATKDKFVSIIAHDLRSPLATFVSLTSVVYEGFDHFGKEQLKQIIADIHKSSQLTFNLLENLLEWSRSQQGIIKFKPAHNDITSIIEDTIDLLEENARNKHIDIIFDYTHDVYAYFDSNMVFTVIRNLASNAIKFTPPQGNIRFNLIETDSYIQVSVTDTGVGIAPEDIDKLFRIDVHFTTQGTNKERGTGLGLILCKEFIERNNGRIWVESEIDKGSSFYVELPKHKQNT